MRRIELDLLTECRDLLKICSMRLALLFFRCLLKTITDTGDSKNIAGALWNGLNLLAQTGDVNMQTMLTILIFLTPHLVNQPLPGEHLAALADKHLEQIILDRGEGEQFASQCHLPTVKIDRERTRLEIHLTLFVGGRKSMSVAALLQDAVFLLLVLWQSLPCCWPDALRST